ncbi:DUF4435 domain-containing protein [Microcoleus asticus]|uniref:DUF4435 domain-containing protein n=1 Tax=Microcoleus asticus IPMA8 TaxID=2563858 RepID=A0ABX2D299_9CYAN|nr:DUF4435 domain-containing protein [Microcoleus asticus]NQE36646.1 hypothetical protein [Microcoleus asticus IPMA8]
MKGQSRPIYTPETYQNYLKISNGKHLLVEGKNDKEFFNLLIYELNKINKTRSRPKVLIDSVCEIKVEGISGNRAQVEFICQMIESKSLADKCLANKLVGFVDREFREFEYDPVFRDNRPEHVVQGRLVWSRGHSIENYFFDSSILEDLLISISSNNLNLELFYTALEKFQSVINATIRLACAVSLAAKECGKIDKIKDRRIEWEFITINNQEENMSRNVIFNFEQWINHLVDNKKDRNKVIIEKDEVNSLYNSYKSWNQKIKNVDLSLVKWLCHGHISMELIRSVYSRCVYDSAVDNQLDKPEAEVSKTETHNNGHRFKACATSWSKKAISNQCEYPIEVLKLLGF